MRSPRGLCSWPHGPSEVPVFEDPAKITLAPAKNNSDLSFYIEAENAPISTLRDMQKLAMVQLLKSNFGVSLQQTRLSQ